MQNSTLRQGTGEKPGLGHSKKLKRSLRSTVQVGDFKELPEGKAISHLWAKSLLERTVSASRRGLEMILHTSKIENSTLDTLEKGGSVDSAGKMIPLVDENGNAVLRMRNFRPIKHARSGQSQLFVYRAHMERNPGDFAKEGEIDAEGNKIKIPTDEVVIKFWAGGIDGQHNLTKDLQFYEAAARVPLSSSDQTGKHHTLLEWTPFVCHIPAHNMPTGCGGVLVTRESGSSLYDILTDDNPEERSAVRRILWDHFAHKHEFHEKELTWKGRISTILDGGYIADHTAGQLIFDPKGKLYDPDSTVERTKIEEQCEYALGLVVGGEHEQAGIMRKFRELIDGFQGFIKKQPVEQWCREDLDMMIALLEPKNRGQLPPLMQRMVKEFNKCSDDFVGKRFPVTWGMLGDLALQMAMELQIREKRKDALDVFEHDYLQLVTLQKKYDPEAHLRSIDRIFNQGYTSLQEISRLFYRIVKPSQDYDLWIKVARFREPYKAKIREANKIMKLVQQLLPSICSEWASFCAPDFHWGNILIGPQPPKRTDKETHRCLIIDQAREWPQEDPEPLSGSSIAPISFLQVRRRESIPEYDREYCEERLRRIADKCGIAIGLERPEQRNCQREIVKAEACFYDVMRHLRFVAAQSAKGADFTEIASMIDFDRITTMLDQGLGEVNKLKEHLIAKEKTYFRNQHEKRIARKTRKVNIEPDPENTQPSTKEPKQHKAWHATQQRKYEQWLQDRAKTEL